MIDEGEMMKRILLIGVVTLLIGCGTQQNANSNYYSPPDTCDGAPGCAVSAIIEGVLKTDDASRKCADLRGEQKQACDSQVSEITESIRKAQAERLR
jgi:hypothetical protein